MKISILDDYQDVIRTLACFSKLAGHDVTVWNDHTTDTDVLAERLKDTEALVLIRERTPIRAPLIERLPKLKFMVLTGLRAPSLDLAACSARRIPVSNTGAGNTNAPTAELSWLLILAAARDFAKAERGMRAGRWHDGLAGGMILEGKRLGLLGLGKLGARVARYGLAFGMDVVAWSQNLTAERAAAAGAHPVSKEVLLETSDVVSIHLVLSERTRGLLGAAEFARIKPGAILVNTSRGPIVDEGAMLEALKSARLGHAALDVYDQEPLPAGHALRALDNVTLSPHLGYVSEDVFRVFYQGALEDIEAWLDGAPIRVMNPEALA